MSLTLVLLLAIAAPAFAQTSGGQAPRKDWTVEVFGGLTAGRISSAGTTTMPEPGAPIATSSPIFPSWRVPSWFFGDGAAFLNNVNAEFDLAERLVPLDAALGRPGVAASGTVHAGVRLRRPLTGMFAVEISADLMPISAGISGDLAAAIDTTRDSFERAFGALLASGPFTAVNIDTTASTTGGSSRALALTVALEQALSPRGGLTPYAVAGGGLLIETGTPPAVTVTGRYEFLVDGQVPIRETDQITLRPVEKATPVLVAGGGVRRHLSGRWGWQIDARALIGRDPSRILIDATPLAETGTPAGFVESFTYPNLQFSNHATTGRVSTLGGTGLDGFEAFSGGWQARVRVTVGVFTRF